MNMTMTISDQQLAIVHFVETFRRAHPMGPSLEEIAAEIHRTKNPVWLHVQTLLRQGVLRAEFDSANHNRIRAGSLHVAPEYRKRLQKD